MTDFVAARRTMVENQLRTYDVTDQTLLAAFETVPREVFVTPDQAAFAYLDRTLVARDGKTMLLQPMVLARMIQSLELSRGERVLSVGGAGYAAAVLSATGVEAIALEADIAPTRAALDAAVFKHVPVFAGELAAGLPKNGPYDAILVNGAADLEPTTLLGQLKEDGALSIIMGRGRSARASVFKKVGLTFSRARAFDAAGPTLAGFEQRAEFVF